MTGVITSLPPLIEQPPGNNSSNPAGLPGYTYTIALLGFTQTWTALQTFPQGNISIHYQDVIGLTSAIQGVTALSVKTITAAGPYAALSTDDVLIIKQAVGAAFTVTVDWSTRLSPNPRPLRVIDGKGDADVNNITITPTAGQTQFTVVNYSYVINGIGGSITLTPLPDGTGAY